MTNEEKQKLHQELNKEGSSYRKYGFPKKDLKDIQYSKNYKCPNCGNEPPEVYNEREVYEANGEIYPQYYNEYLSSTDMGTTHDWDEVHCCLNCGIIFYFRNGCF